MNAILKSSGAVEGDEHHYAVYGNEVVCMSGTSPSERHFEAELLIRSKANSGYIVAPRNQVFLVSTLRENSMRLAGTAAAGILERVNKKRATAESYKLAPVFAPKPSQPHEFVIHLTVEHVCNWAIRNGIPITPIRAERALLLLRKRFEQGYDFGYDALARCIKDASLPKKTLLIV